MFWKQRKGIYIVLEGHNYNNTDEDTILVEPFCGSVIILKSLHNEGNIKQFHINDIDTYRIEFYNNMKDEKKRGELHKIETTIKEKGKEEYIKYVNKDKMIIGLM